MAEIEARPQPTSTELKGRVEWLHFVLEAARREGRVITAAEHSVFQRYVAGEIDGDEVRRRLLRLFETGERIDALDH
jgi:Antitoxin VbhA